MISIPIFSREPRLYKRVCPSMGPSVRPWVRGSVRNAFFLAGRNEDGERLMPCIRPYYVLSSSAWKRRLVGVHLIILKILCTYPMNVKPYVQCSLMNATSFTYSLVWSRWGRQIHKPLLLSFPLAHKTRFQSLGLEGKVGGGGGGGGEDEEERMRRRKQNTQAL